MCQEDDWSIHKLVCKQFIKLGNPPGPRYQRVIFFSDTEKRPRFAWVPLPGFTPAAVHAEVERVRRPFPRCTVETIAVPDPAMMGADGLWGMDSIETIREDSIFHCPEHPKINISRHPLRYSPFLARPNRSITVVNPELGPVWTGPIITTAFNDRNLIPADFRRVVDLLRMNFVCKKTYLKLLDEDDKGLMGVRLSCEGDQRVCRRPYMEEFRIPTESTKIMPLPSGVGERVGIPLFVVQCPRVMGMPWLDRRFSSGEKILESSYNLSGLLLRASKRVQR
ncbi:hypothetical protein K491DRAFT_721233 [Lophiostoma macrostomum CBS 122681]|uniref:MYND-type zinc finger protein samB n=1 Tax=Lophiostoma macrostomum CBS 122681 TaxID=1314788 RepID=A0A6A6SUM1_9PLEO|nr:hypothetical protein K491DRAFT_721233 [Lophiostoma macrostomum CBS 122681]